MLHQSEYSESDEFTHSANLTAQQVDPLCQPWENMMEDYLDRVCAPLVGQVTREKREEIRQRVRQRLQQFAAAHRELGSTPSEAVDLAIVQCGPPEVISSRWLRNNTANLAAQTGASGRTSEKLPDRLFGTAKASTAVATLTFGLPYIAFLSQMSGHIESTIQQPSVTFNRVWLFAVPLLAGLLTGLAAKSRPGRGVVNAIGLITLQAIAIFGLTGSLAIAEIGPDLTQYAGASLLAVVCGLVPWLLLGCAGTAAGRRIRKLGCRVTTRAGRAFRTRRR